VLSRNGSYRKNPDVTVRTFEEWGRAYAYTPDEPELHDLNTSAWFILELCDGRPFRDIERDYVAVVGGKIGDDSARIQFHSGFDALLQRNIISVCE
jgi:hypothetical protein